MGLVKFGHHEGDAGYDYSDSPTVSPAAKAEVAYTDAQRLTIALAELASALGVQLTRNDAPDSDWRLVDRLTAHVRAQSGIEWPAVGGSPGTPQGDMEIISYALRDRDVQREVVAAFNRTLVRIVLVARNEAYALNQAARETSRAHNEGARASAAPPPTGEAFLALADRVAVLEAKART